MSKQQTAKRSPREGGQGAQSQKESREESRGETREELKRRVERLEVRSAFQEQLAQELSDQIYELHGVIGALKGELEALKRRAQEGEDAPSLGPALDPPPHY